LQRDGQHHDLVERVGNADDAGELDGRVHARSCTSSFGGRHVRTAVLIISVRRPVKCT
jgi:hypothetical protein